jgi:hypothetical protein
VKIALLIVLLSLSPVSVANRCAGEAEFAVEACACTVRNRLAEGWAESKVLSAYFARDSHATPAQIAQVASVLDGSTACGAEYFMYSKFDVIALGLEHYTPVRVVRDGEKAVLFFERWFRR